MTRAFIAVFLLLSLPAAAQQTETFSKYFQGLPSASAPLNTSAMMILQSGVTKQAPVTQISSATVNLSSWGVKCDGTTDDSSAINSAISSISSGILQFPAGTCIIGTTPIMLKQGIYLQGSGKNSTIIKATGTLTGTGFLIDAFTGGTFTNVGVSDLTLNVNNQTNQGAIRFQGAIGECYINRIAVIHMTAFGIVGQQMIGCEISDNDVTKDAAANSQNEGILLTAAVQNTNVIIKRNTLTNTGMELDGDYLFVDGNFITGFKFGSGITIGPGSVTHDNIIIENTSMNSSGQDTNSVYPGGLELWCPRCVVVGNNANNNSGNGIMIGGADMTVVGNVCYDNGQSAHAGDENGILAQYVSASVNANNSVVSGNSCFNSAGTTQAYGYAEASSSLTGIVLGVNNFSGSTADVNIMGTPGTDRMGNIVANSVSTSSYGASGLSGVSCAAGTVSIGSFTVTDGLVTHC